VGSGSVIRLVAILLLAVGVFCFTVVMALRIRALVRLRPSGRFDHLGERTRALFHFGFGQSRMVDPEERVPGVMHVLIFVAFLVLAARTVSLYAIALSPSASRLLVQSEPGPLYGAFLFLKDVVVLGALIGAAYFIGLRLFVKPDRMRTGLQAYVILALIELLMITEITYSAAVRSSLPLSPFEPLAALITPLFSLIDPAWARPIGQAALVLHLLIIVAFLNFLPFGKHFHVITALPNVFFLRLEPSGKLRTLDLAREDFGARTIGDLDWKEGLDLYSCTECGRCQTHCPTYLTHKPLTHKEVNQDLLGHIGRREQPLIGAILDPETPWACTTCGWCETACPVFIENIPRLIDMRRYKVLVDAEFPQEIRRTFDALERQANPWGLGRDKRADWAGDLAVPIWSAAEPPEYLFFVGCAGSYDEGQKRVSRAIVAILREAGVSFAILGSDEACSGDPARRLGNEYLFQQLAQENVSRFDEEGVTTILVQCPHCLNTLQNEYPDFGGRYRVKTHVELIEELIREGRITLAHGKAIRATFHDPCYLGRHNGIYEQPRDALASVPGLRLVEMQRSRRQSYCCGAGGGRMWMEERIGRRINQDRVNEAALTLAHSVDPKIPFPKATDRKQPGLVGHYEGPSAPGMIAVACPFCRTMMADGVAETGREEELHVKDIAEIVAGAMERKR
jgi:Fe-S oxidoreductase